MGETTLALVRQRRSSGCFPVLDLRFRSGELFAIRSSVEAHAHRADLDQLLIRYLVLVASELALNAVRHGGGRGWLRMWCDDHEVFIQVTDNGPGMADPDQVGRHKPSPEQSHGRGLWVVRMVCTRMRVDSSSTGTTVIGTLALDTTAAADGSDDWTILQ